MRLILGKIAVFALMACLLGACSQGGAVEIGDAVPDFSLADMNGKTTGISEFKGKVIILDFFASWCPPCREEIPDFVELQKAYGAQGFTVVGVSLVTPEESKEFAKKMGINYPVLVDDGKVSMAYGPIRSIPTTFVIGKDFKVAKKYIGYRSRDIFEADIKDLLK